MSHEKEPKKLTPDSGNSYDGSGTNMSEKDHQLGESKEPENGDQEASDQADESEDSNEQDNGDHPEKEKNKSAFAEFKKALIALIVPRGQRRTEEQRKASAKALSDFAKTDTTSKEQSREERIEENQQKERLVELFSLIATPEQIDPHSKDTEIQEVDAWRELYDDLLDVAEDAGFDVEEITDAVAQVVEEQPLVSAKDRIDKLDQYLKEKIENAALNNVDALKQLKQDLSVLTYLGVAGNETEQTAAQAESLLDKILKDVEVHTDTVEEDDAEQWFAKYAAVVERVFAAVPEVPPTQEKVTVEVETKQEENKELTKVQKEQVQLFMDIVLTGSDPKKDSKTEKANRVAAMLAEYAQLEGEGESFGQNKAVREEIFKIAKAAGLDTTEIEVNEVAGETTIVKGYKDGEEHEEYVGNSFEELVEQQIINATPQDVKDIKKLWVELLKKVDPESDIARDAKGAIVILDDIIRLKEAKHNSRGEKLNPHDFAPPRDFDQRLEPKEHDIFSEAKQDKNTDAKQKLNEVLNKLLLNVDPTLSEEDAVTFQMLTMWIVASNKTPEAKEKAIMTLLASFPVKEHSAKEEQIHTLIIDVAAREGILFTGDDIEQANKAEKKPGKGQQSAQKQLQEVITEAIQTGDRENLERMQNVWLQMLDNPELHAELRRNLSDAVSQIETIGKTSKELSRDQLIEREVAAIERYARSLNDLFISRPHALESMESEAVAALVQTIVIHYINDPQSKSENLAEKEIAKLLLVFGGDGNTPEARRETTAIKKLIWERAEAIGLQKREIFLEYSRLMDDSTTNDFKQLIADSLGRATEADLGELQTLESMWNKLANSGTVGPLQIFAEQAEKALHNIAFSKETLANSELEVPLVEPPKEQKKHEPDTVVRIDALKEHLTNVTNKELHEYLEQLITKLESEPLSAQETAAVLKKLEAKARAIQESFRTSKADEKAKNKASAKVREIEKAVKPFRTFLKGSLQELEEQGVVHEAQAEIAGQVPVTEKLVEAFVEETETINGFDNYSDLTVERFKNYANRLNEIVLTTNELTQDQLIAAYIAFRTQADILALEAEHQGLSGKAINEFQKVQQETLPAYRAIVSKIQNANIKKVHTVELAATAANKDQRNRTVMHVEGNDDNSTTDAEAFRDTFAAANSVVLSNVGRYRDQSDFTFSQQTKNITRVPVDVPGQYGRGTETEYLEDDTVGELMTSAQAMEASMPALTPATPQGEREVYQRFNRDRMNAIYANEAQLEASVKELNDMISDAIRNNKSDGMVSITNIGAARSLAESMFRQRMELARLKGYKGLILQRSEQDTALYEGTIHSVLGERMRRIRVYYGVEQAQQKESGELEEYTAEDVKRYYKELQRWTRILLKNDVRKRPQDARNPDVLRLATSVYDQFNDIVKTKIESDLDVAANQAEILNQIDFMLDESQGNFLRYFKQNAPNPEKRGELLGVPYQRPEDMGPYAPESLEATMNMIAKEFGTEFQVGGAHELITAEGEFMYQNFVYWIRKKINEDVDYNKDGPINPFGKIIIKLDMGQISMYELLLLIPEYTSQRDYVIKMDSKDNNQVYSGWGEKKESEELKWGELDLIAAEMEFRQMTHDIRKDFMPTSISNNKEQYLNLMRKLHHSNHWTRGSNVFLWLGIPSASKGREEMSDWIRKEKQGSLGKALSDMLVSYYYLSELTDYTKMWKKDEKTGKHKEVTKNFNENMFYRFLEPDGANRMLISMAEGALGYNNNAKQAYSQFIAERIKAAAQKYRDENSLSNDSEEGKLLTQLEKEWTPEDTDASLEVIFTESEQLKNFLRLVETRVLGKTVDEKDLNTRVKMDLVTNLREGYFNKLRNMRVAKIAAKQPKRDQKSSNRILRTEKETIRFGEIKLEGGGTMDELLNNFDVDQILLFDFVSSDPNDPKNPFRAFLDRPDLLRFKIDEFMDPSRNRRNHELFKANEKMMINFTRHITRIDRKDLNHFRDAEELEFARDILKRGMMRTMEKAYGIDSVESEYAWWWARDYIYLWGIGAYLDVDGIGFRWDGKIMNPGRWRPRRQGKDSGGNAHTFDEFRVFSLPFLHHVRVSNIEEEEPLGARSIFYWMQGGDGGRITPRAIREFRTRSTYTFQQHAEALYVDNTLENSSELLELLSKTEFDVSNIVSFDVLGNVVFDFTKAREVFGKWRKAARYAFGKNGLDYREVIWANGRERRLYEYFFGPKTRALNQLIFKNTPRTLEFMYKDPADAIMMSIIAAEVYEHRAMFSPAHHWSIQNVHELEKFLIDFMTEAKPTEDEYGEQHTSPTKEPTLFSPKIFRAALKAYHTSYAKMYTTEFGSTLGAGSLRGIGAFIKAFFTKGKWIY